MNLADLKDEILGHQFSVSRYEAYVTRQLNRAQLQIADRMDFRSLFAYDDVTTVADQAGLVLPDDYMRLDSLWNNTDSTNAVPLTQFDNDDFFALPVTQGVPTRYTLQSTFVSISPTADGAYNLTFQYHRKPVEMDDDGDVPEIDSRCDQLLVRYALARCFERENDTTQAQYHWARYQEEFIYTMASIEDDQDDIGQPRQLEGTWPDQGSGITVIRP